jgi:exodeoxyribonuclease V beta subunit
MRELEHLDVELSGRNLIEASAGTGKTYAIACLYLRLLIEKGLTPEQILVVTYTEAATEELRGRIRNRIREALDVFAGKATDDCFLSGLAANANGKGPDKKTSLDNLDRALKSFDTASIFTIHGFCLRALQDNAFESGSLYDTELVTNQTELLQEIIDDFWRIRFFAEPAPLLGYALRNGYSTGYFMRFLKGMLSNSKLEIVPRYSPGEVSAIEDVCRVSFEMVRGEWLEKKPDIMDLIRNDKGLGRAADTYRADLLPPLFESMDSFAAGDNPFDLFPGFSKFSTSGIAKGKKPTGMVPTHPFFDYCEELKGIVAERFLALKWELILFGRERLPFRKREINIRYFDDLLNDLYVSLQGRNGDGFAGVLRNRYRAALIDEFQDTDPVQFDIFRKIYDEPEAPLFLIGDPKQAIYSFRGADIFAYLEAAGDVKDHKRFTLTRNWRSTSGLLVAFNTIFSTGAKPFVFSDIAYHPVKPGKKEKEQQLVFRDRDNCSLQIWHMPPDEKGVPSSVGNANLVIPPAVASEIARLLMDGVEGKAFIGERPLLPGDIAVIVRSHRQAAFIQDALRRLGIPSVMRSDKSIFTTDEAREVVTLLGALADPGSESKVRAALVTDIFGKSGNDIAALLEDEQAWEEWLEKFRAYHQEWLDRGFMVMSRFLLAVEGVRGRLLRRPDGERRLTNVLHCFEVIHHASHERGSAIEGLLTWFGERVSEKDAAEEFQIRLETDEKAVKIVTVHVSKGLEYPVVFCPFMWSGLMGDDELATFHDGFALVKDFGSPDFDRNMIAARKETLAESLRLLYVALTRAQYRCYLLGGKVVGRRGSNMPETSSLSWLLHSSETTREAADPVSRLADEVGSFSVETMNQQLQRLALASAGNISVSRMPAPDVDSLYEPAGDESTQLSCRVFTGEIAGEWRVASFTSFSAHERSSGELPDRDETGAEELASKPAAAVEEPKGMSFFTFPRGAQAGIFLHEIFEQLDFARYDADTISPLVEKGLEKYGYDRVWLPHVCSMVNNVVTAPLASSSGVFSLAGLKEGSWITELEFFFPLRFVTSDILRSYFRRWSDGYDDSDLHRLCRSLRFSPVQGMVRGFMDMVFKQDEKYYLLDWKSNHLGYRPEDYSREKLKDAMVSKLYPLQYLLYTVALNRYLSLRDKDYSYATHFGGVLYVFLRGVSPGQGEDFGFFRDTPSRAMIDDLTECLIQAGG